MIETCSCTDNLLASKIKLFGFINVIFDFVAMMVSMSRRVEIAIDCNDEREAVSTSNGLSWGF